MDGQTQALVEDIAEALEDEYGIVSRRTLELAHGMRIGGNLYELIEIARTGRSLNADEDARIERELGTLNAHIPGYILTSDGAGYVTVGSEFKRLRALGVDAVVAFRIVNDPRYRAALP